LVALGLSPILSAQPAATDPEIEKGVRLVDEGDYDAAIVTLDGAVRRLAANPARGRDLSQAYLYLGIAYVGKGHEAAAKAKFREAVAQIKDLTLSADKYPPKVIDLFEAAKDEAARARAATAAPATTAPATARPAAPPAGSASTSRGGGSKRWLVLGGAGALAAGGGAYALLKGDGSCDIAFLEQTGVFNTSQTLVQFPAGPAEAGHWNAYVEWTVTSSGGASAQSGGRTAAVAPPVGVKIEVYDSRGVRVATSILLSETESEAGWDAAAGETFQVKVGLEGTGAVSWQLFVEGPCL
jgi:hypothetical protein